MKNFLSDLNPQLVSFVKALKESPELYIFPLVKNLNKANAEIIKDILSSSNEKLRKLQLCVFEFLLFYFLNEQFGPEDLQERFANLLDIFRFAQTIDIVYSYKLKYEHTLYSEEFVKNEANKELIYSLKLVLLNYIAITKQIKTCKKPEVFLESYKKYASSPKVLFYVRDLLQFFEVLSRNKEFELNEVFLKRLFRVLLSFPNKDVIHFTAFKLLENQIKTLNSSPVLLSLLSEFLL